MKYDAVNAKIKAMSAKLPDSMPMDIDALKEDAIRICRYIPDKNLRGFITQLAAPPEKDIHYYIAQWKRLTKLDRANRHVLRGILGAEIDITNILWMYRLKKYRRIYGNATYGYLIPIRHRLTRAATQRMADCETAKALREEIAACPYAKDISFTAQKGQSDNKESKRLTPEQQLAHAISKRCQTAAKRYPNSLAPAVSYIYCTKAYAHTGLFLMGKPKK